MPKKKPQYQIPPGALIVINTSEVWGGVSYDRTLVKESERGPRVKRRIQTVMIVDNKKLVARGDKLYQDARHVIRARAASTAVGFICDDKVLKGIEAAMEVMANQADGFNSRAHRAGSNRRVHVGMVATDLSTSNSAAAREIARTVRNIFSEMIDTLHAGDANGLAKTLTRARNLELVAKGRWRALIVAALENAKVARSHLRDAKKAKKSLTHVGRRLDLSDLEKCVEAFSSDTALRRLAMVG